MPLRDSEAKAKNLPRLHSTAVFRVYYSKHLIVASAFEQTAQKIFALYFAWCFNEWSFEGLFLISDFIE